MPLADSSQAMKEGPARTAKRVLLAELAIGYLLIMITVWSPNPQQRMLFWITAAWFFLAGILAKARGDLLGFKRPPLRVTVLIIAGAILIAVSMGAIATLLGTLHGLFGVRTPLLHAFTYITWSLVQQYIQQSFFLARIEKFTPNGLAASLITAVLFGLAHLPNPVLTAVTFGGGWILSELFRRYRSLYPLGVAHGLVGLAIAVSVPDHIHHHMRVGLGYLRYPR